MSGIDKWKEENIGEGLKLLSGYPFSSSKFSNEDGFPLIRIRDIVDSSIETYYLGRFLPMYVIKQDDMLVGMDGDFNLARWKNQDALLNQRVLKVDVLDSEKLDREFVYYWLQPYVRKVNELTAATTVKHLSTKDIRRAKSKIPALLAQRKIGKILKTIDQTIEKTEALIEKYQQIKAGLMHDLFTRGIGADGKLRPPREQAPELYQATPIGWIPKEWGLKSCADICTRICVGIVIQPTQYYVEDGVPAFRSANVRESGITSSNLVYISQKANQVLSKSQVKAGDILSVRTGYPGTSAIVPQEYDGANCVDILISTPGASVISEYLCSWINSSFGKEQVLRQQGGMAQQHFNVGEMRELLVALPDLNEQEAISCRLKACSDKLLTEKEILQKLIKQKSGLMHDLLTGKVQVKIREAEAANA